jgi:DNA-binding winged helix-turn-helix (wHTH) protein/Tfp pilus assembly protein PilF
MPKPKDLAARPDFTLGPLTISPGRRLVQSSAGEIHVEPLIMHVLLRLLDGRGKIVTRDELFEQVWGGVIVGDDSLNRAVGKVRRVGDELAPGLFEIETIPRTGYRVTLRDGVEPIGMAVPNYDRRTVVAVAGAAAVVGAGGLWWASRPKSDPRFDALMERGQEAIRLDEPQTAKYFEQAVAIEPRNAKAWGLLAYALANGIGGPGLIAGPPAQAAEQAARKALAIDPKEPNALLAMTVVQSSMLDWLSRESRYRSILGIDPNNTLVMRSLGTMLHGVGRSRESLAVAERAIAIEPLCPDHQVRRAGRLWVLGRVAAADQVINRAMELWPSHRLVRLMRLMIYAYTGRARAALAMVDDEAKHPIFFGPGAATTWRKSLDALETPTTTTIAAAREANVQGASGSPQIAAWAILTLSALGELDAAFDVANGFLLDRGSVIVRPRAETNGSTVNGLGWRNTFGLFTPPTKAMRLDPRFKPLADGLGLTEYWRRRGLGPDAFLFKR